MADEADVAQASYDDFNESQIAAVRRGKSNSYLPECENECGNKVFVTDKGTRARFCKECWEEYQASRV